MSGLRCIVYVSTAARDLGAAELDALLASARSFNGRRGITGALLYSFPNFLQLLEGESDAIELVMSRVLRARAHTDLHVLFDAELDQRQFDGWHMALVRPPQSDLQAIAQASWESTMQATSPTSGTIGLELLAETWRRWQVHVARSRE